MLTAKNRCAVAETMEFQRVLMIVPADGVPIKNATRLNVQSIICFNIFRPRTRYSPPLFSLGMYCSKIFAWEFRRKREDVFYRALMGNHNYSQFHLSVMSFQIRTSTVARSEGLRGKHTVFKFLLSRCNRISTTFCGQVTFFRTIYGIKIENYVWTFWSKWLSIWIHFFREFQYFRL
jgi:hypothetical protein